MLFGDKQIAYQILLETDPSKMKNMEDLLRILMIKFGMKISLLLFIMVII